MHQIHQNSGRISLASILCILTILFSACRSNTSTTLAAKQVLREPIIGGDFDSLDPALTTSGLGEPFNIIFTGLVAADDQGNIHDQAALSHQISADGLTYTFHLRPNLKFSDGTKLDANDFAYSINRTIDPATKSSVSSYLSLIKGYDQFSAGKLKTLIGYSIIVNDANTLMLILSKPASYFLPALNYSTSYAVNKRLITKYGSNWTDHLQEGAGAGPFKVKSYSHSTGLVLVPNPNYYGPHSKIQEIDEIITGDRDSTFKSMLAGQFDIAPIPPANQSANKHKPGYQSSSALAMRYIGMNYLVKPLNNIQIRQALALALNRDLIINGTIGKGNVTPSYHIILKGIPGYNPQLKGPAGVMSTTGDRAIARTLFQQGLKAEGYSNASQLPTISLAYDISYKAGANTMSAVANEWQAVLGFKVKLVGMQPNDLISQEFATVGKASPLQMFYATWNADYLDPQDFTTLFFGKGAQQNAFNYGQNNSKQASEQQAVQDELAKADVTQDQAIRLKMYQDAEQKLVNDVPYITTYQSAYAYLINPRLKGWKIGPLGGMATNDWAKVYFTS